MRRDCLIKPVPIYARDGGNEMKYRFNVENIVAARGKLSRDERHDVTRYFQSTMIDAEDERKAYRILAKQAAGRLSKDSGEKEAMITLPDYGNCQVVVKAYAED